MTTLTASAGHALWRVAIPPIVVNAGAGGAMLSITLLRSTVLTLYGGHSFVLHDPLGLMGDRLLAHVHRALADYPAPPAAACRWVTARGPLEAVWEAAETLSRRGVWRLPRRRWLDSRGAGRAPRVAEVRAEGAGRVAESSASADGGPGDERVGARLEARGVPDGRQGAAGTGQEATLPRVLLLSESDRADALAPVAAARLLLRAMRHDWAVFAVTRQGPARVAESLVEGTERAARTSRAWCTHLVCRGGVLEPLRVAAPDTATPVRPARCD